MRFVLFLVSAAILTAPASAQLKRLSYNNPGLVVDLGVGLWAQPLPMDYDNDGDMDLLVATAGVPSNGVYFFENPGGDIDDPVFKPGVRVSDAKHNLTISYTEAGPVVMLENNRLPDFRDSGLKNPVPLECAVPKPGERMRAKQWKLVDYDGDGDLDVLIGIGVWDDYGWDDAWDKRGKWTNGPLHGYVYVSLNTGSDDTPKYGEPFQLQAGDTSVDVYGAPSPNLADFDNDGDLDLICGEFLDLIKYFENTGTRSEPIYAPGRFLIQNGQRLSMELQMLQVVAVDWNGDGWTDIIVGEEDGRVAYLKHTGKVKDGYPQFAAPHYFRQEADVVKVGALCTPYGVDWDNDGDDDLIVGDTAGYLSFVENLDGGNPPKWAAQVHLQANGKVIRIQAGPKGSIQGPAEAKWGYTVPNVADLNGDGLLDIVINSILGEIVWYENRGTPEKAKLWKAENVQVRWNDRTPKPEWVWWRAQEGQLITQWRTTPVAFDWNSDGLMDLIMLDREGYLAWFRKQKWGTSSELTPGKRVFVDAKGEPLRLNERGAGKSGRRKLAIADWDGDGFPDLLVNSKNIDWYRNLGEAEGLWTFEAMGALAEEKLAGHTTSPTVVDWDKNGLVDLVVGGEDGFLYYMTNPRAASDAPSD
ncbi:MAG: hypothetical protein COA73_13450 [Candidatus Hydrogenedentota bacterium]|nr:MAG: hypothetical protein COA73_13450 [Candidatus Hydrogenedentota bacterium]